MKITDYQIHRLHLPLREPIGDSQVHFTDHWITAIELVCDDGIKGVGFDCQQGLPPASLPSLREQFEYALWPSLAQADPLNLAMKIQRPRGGNVGCGFPTPPIEPALWDLASKQAQVPLFQLLGGTDPQVKAYGSTLDFHLNDDDFRTKLEQMNKYGFSAFKIKVGHPDLSWDLKRLQLVRDVVGHDIHLMVDANEAWSVKETLQRLQAYRNAGHEIFWIEDPITREDYAGNAKLCSELESTRINTGEYLNISGKRQLLVSGAVDVLNIHNSIHEGRFAAMLAGEYGVPVSLGNTLLELGVHLAASLPECLYLEYSDLIWNELAVEPIRVEQGCAWAPQRPGHGIELDPDKVAFYAKPE